MKKGNASLFGTTLVITAAIVAGLYLLGRAQESAEPGSAEESGWTTLISSPSTLPAPRHPGPDPGSNISPDTNPAASAGNVSAETPPSGNDTIITCQHPEYGTVYSNAASCDEVDYDNRLSRAESYQAVPERDRYSGTDYHSPESAAANSRSYSTNKKQQKPSLQLHGKSPPSGLNVSCKFSVGKALEIERSLAVSDDPHESSWRESYCKFRCEAIEENCPVADDYFYYRYRHVCQGSEEYWPCYPGAS